MLNGGNTQDVLPPISYTMSAPADTTALNLALPPETSFPDWMGLGRSLIRERQVLDWMLADWVVFGREKFPEQIELALADVSDDPRNLKRIEKTARAFPAHLRDASLSFDHHAHVADMPVQEALPLLKLAREEHLPARQLRIKAMLRKVETGQLLPREEDAEDDALRALCVAWNRAPKHVRSEFAEMVVESDLGVIDA